VLAARRFERLREIASGLHTKAHLIELDVNRITSLYASDARHTSARVRWLGGSEDTVRGKEAIAEYFRRALEKYPALHFEPITVSTGPRTVAIEYRAQGSGRDEVTVELLELDADGLIERSRVYHQG